MKILNILKTILKYCAYVAVMAEFLEFAIKKLEYLNHEQTPFEEVKTENDE